MKKLRLGSIFMGGVLLTASLFAFAGCGEEKIVIWTSGEDYKNNFYLSELNKQFPQYNIRLDYLSSSQIANKVIAEGNDCSADIICSEEYGYLTKCEEYLAELTEFDYSVYLPEIVPESRKYTPELKNGGCVIINRKVLDENKVSVPQSYQDLLDVKYKNLISMPNPSSSGTGYMFLKQFVNEWGEEQAFAWFDDFTKNVLSYTTSGSGPVNALIQGEVGIGLGMISQAVTEINEGAELEILFFEEGAPYSMYGNAVMQKSVAKEGVMDVFNYLATTLCKESNTRYFPDQIYRDYVPEVTGYPKNVKYGDMRGDTLAEKERLLKQWKY